MFFLALAVFLYVPEPDLLPLNETVNLNQDVTISDEVAELFEVSEFVFTVRSVTRRVSLLGWLSERYDLEIGNELKGDMPDSTVFLYTFPCGMYSNQLSSLTEGDALVVCASIQSSAGVMEGLRASLGTMSVCLYSPGSK